MHVVTSKCSQLEWSLFTSVIHPTPAILLPPPTIQPFIMQIMALLVFLLMSITFGCNPSSHQSGGKPSGGKPGGGKPGAEKPGGGKPSGSCQRGYSRKTLTSQTVDNVKASLKQSLFFNRADRYAHTVRIAFHDCVGGCDGCINRDNPDNAGPMLETLTVVDSIYDSLYRDYMSRADFYIEMCWV